MGAINGCCAQRFIGNATSSHEIQAIFNLACQCLVARASTGGLHELTIPLVQAVKVCGARARQRAHQVHSGRRVRIRTNHACRIMAACFLGGLYAVDDVTAVVEQTIAIKIRRTRLGILPSNARKLHHWGRCAVSQHHCHLQQGLDIATDVRLGIGLKSLRALTSL